MSCDKELVGGEWVLRNGIRIHTGHEAQIRRAKHTRDQKVAGHVRALLAERYAEPTWFANPGPVEPAPDPNGFQRLREALADAEAHRGWERGHKWGAVA